MLFMIEKKILMIVLFIIETKEDTKNVTSGDDNGNVNKRKNDNPHCKCIIF